MHKILGPFYPVPQYKMKCTKFCASAYHYFIDATIFAHFGIPIAELPSESESTVGAISGTLWRLLALESCALGDYLKNAQFPNRTKILCKFMTSSCSRHLFFGKMVSQNLVQVGDMMVQRGNNFLVTSVL